MSAAEASGARTTIGALRRGRGWTQFELALAVGVQPQTVYLWESGRRQPQVLQMRKLGQVFGICSDAIDLTAPPDPRPAPSHASAHDYVPHAHDDAPR